jgi:NTE family protein
VVQADGVFSGGGVKAIAFAGAIRAAEEAGYTDWVRVAGTSAGAITAMALAVGYDSAQLKVLLERTDFGTLADTGGLPGEIVNIATHRGLTRGKALHEWLRSVLRDAPRKAMTFGELGDTSLQVVGTDVAHQRIVVFPDDVELYEDGNGNALRPDEFPIADAVRVSAGYPFFFPPLTLRDRVTGRDGVLVDGGVSSAFPVFLFDRPAPKHPTWGFRLHGGLSATSPPYEEIDGLDWPVEMARAILDTAMNAFDAHNVIAFGDRTVSIPTGDVPTLDFSLSREQQEFLYTSGHDAAKAFFDAQPDGRNNYGATPAQLAGR